MKDDAYQKALKEIEAAAKTQTTELDLERMGLSELPPEIGKLQNLRVLNLQGNQLTTLPPEIGNLQKLQVLSLHNNQLTTLQPEIGNLLNLEELWLQANQLTTLPPEIGNLQNLQNLYLENNKLTRLPPEFARLKIEYGFGRGDDVIDLANNPLEVPPIEIVEKGRDAVVEYFKALEGEQQAVNEAKVLLVGDGGAGKTSLVKRLLNNEFDKDEPQTDGINISHWQVGKTEIMAHLWDFGGQEIMHATHQFFLSKRSLYVLVLDGRKDEKVEFWLKNIESFGGNSPIMVVINKIDENPGYDVNRVFLQKKYKNIKGFYRISCSKGKGIKDFAQALKSEMADVELINTTWAKSWFKVKTRLENLSEHFINFEKYKEICSDEDIKEDKSQEVLVDFLNDLGVVVHFNDFDLDDIHVLEPEWVTEAVYKIINSEILAENKGVLKLSQLKKILVKKDNDKYDYPHDTHKYIIRLMGKFELCYVIDDKTVLIPDLLEVQESEFKFDYDSSLKVIIQYDFMPKSIMPRFIVNMHKEIKDDLRWRTGLVLENKAFQATAVVKSDPDAKKIEIHVNGNNKLKKEYLSIIRHVFMNINDSFERLDFEELVPCNCSECKSVKPGEKPSFYDYATLIKFRDKDKKDVTCPLSVEDVQIEELLDGIEGKSINTEKEVFSLLREIKENTENKESFLEEASKIFEAKPIDLGIVNFNWLAFLNKFIEKDK